MQLPHSVLRPGQSLPVIFTHRPHRPWTRQTRPLFPTCPSAVYQQPPAYGSTPRQQFTTAPYPQQPGAMTDTPQAYAPYVAPRPAAPPMVQDDDVYLGRSQLVNKQVVTRTTGRSLGFISQMYVDTGRLEVVYMDLKPSQLATETRANLLLSSLRQIGTCVGWWWYTNVGCGVCVRSMCVMSMCPTLCWLGAAQERVFHIARKSVCHIAGKSVCHIAKISASWLCRDTQSRRCILPSCLHSASPLYHPCYR